MSDDLAQALADTETVTVGALRQVLTEALAPIHEYLGRLEGKVGAIEGRLEAVERRLDRLEDSVSTIRRTMADDFRPAIDGLKRGMHLRVLDEE